jgi:DNA-binding NtrC family response regulator
MITERPLRSASPATTHDSLRLHSRRGPTDDGAVATAAGARPCLDDVRRTGGFGPMRGQSPPMMKVYEHMLRVAPTEATVLLTGETGTGKEVAARTIHELSDRRTGAFVAMNCGAVSTSLIESELFGHEQGSFTGASRRHNGVFAQADRGTLFLDEITEMPMDLQVKLLRVLETGEFHRVGGEKSVQTNVRVITASNRSPEQAVRDGRLREDLFYRLRVFPIALPPLRERMLDTVVLANHFLALLNRDGATERQFTAPALARLQAHQWPGNVRELKNFVQQSFILADGDLDCDGLAEPQQPRSEEDRIEVQVGSSIAAVEKQLITATMQRFHGNKLQVAKVLGISLKTLYVRLNVYEACGVAMS